MLLPDVNVLIYSYIEESSTEHSRYARLITDMVKGSEPYALSVLALSGFVRIVTNRRIFDPPAPLYSALEFVACLVDRPSARVIGPGPNHIEIFDRLCRSSGATGKLVADAQHAAVALEHECTLVSNDKDFARFPELQWLHPLELFDARD